MFFKDKKVLVTGGSGFVGSHFVEELLRRGAKVRVPLHRSSLRIKDDSVETIPADLNNFDECLKVCEGTDYVVHAAGAVAAAGVTVTNPMSAISTNLVLTVRVLEAAWVSNVKRILIFSSGTTAYPAVDYAIKEEEMWQAPPPPVYFGYGWMRRYLELVGEFVASKSEVGVAICRPTAVYGRYDNFDPRTSHVIPALILRALKKEDPFIVWGTGEEVRDFLHINDLVKGCLLLIEKHSICDPINIGFGKTASIRDVVKIILKAANHEKAKVEYDAAKPTTIPIRIVDITKARQILGFEPQISLEDGLLDTVRWYKKSYD